MLNKYETRKANQLKRVKVVADIVSEHYEPGNLSKSLSQIYKNVVNPVYPMGERTFWQYMIIAQTELGYCFENENNNLDFVFERLQPKTIETIKDLANSLNRVNTKGKTRKEVFEQNDFGVSYHVFVKNLRIAEIYLGYKFDFKDTERTKQKRELRKVRFLIDG